MTAGRQMGDGPVREGKDYEVGAWHDLPNYQCRLCKGFSTLDLAEMREHARLTHRPGTPAIGGEVTERIVIFGPHGQPL